MAIMEGIKSFICGITFFIIHVVVVFLFVIVIASIIQ
jgi:hypothetical protein